MSKLEHFNEGQPPSELSHPYQGPPELTFLAPDLILPISTQDRNDTANTIELAPPQLILDLDSQTEIPVPQKAGSHAPQEVVRQPALLETREQPTIIPRRIRSAVGQYLSYGPSVPQVDIPHADFEITFVPSHKDIARHEITEILANPDERPTPQRFSRLVEAGLTETTIIDEGDNQGYSLPLMENILTDLNTILPRLPQLNEAIRRDNPTARKLFAGRDAELLFDDYKIRYPEDTKVELLPASMDLWRSHEMEIGDDLAREFLADRGLDNRNVYNPDEQFVLIDSGFQGSVGRHLNKAIKDIYGEDLIAKGRLRASLVSARNPFSFSTEIRSFSLDEMRFSGPDLPHTFDHAGAKAFTDNTHNRLLATALQLMPRYHGHYTDLACTGSRVVAVPENVPVATTFNREKWERLYWNASIVHPVAAAIVQRLVTLNALKNT